MTRKTETGRRRLYPLPVEVLADNQLAMTFPAAAFGMTARLILHFHISGCRPLPTADHELMHIARAHAPTWRHWKTQVMQVVNECLPEIEAYTRLRDSRGTTLSFAAHKGQAKKRLKVLLDSAPTSAPALSIPQKSDRGPVNPTPAKARRVLTDRR